MYARVPQAMAQFVLKIEKLSLIMGPTPILEMARAYGLRPRSWLLVKPIMKLRYEALKARYLTSLDVKRPKLTIKNNKKNYNFFF